MPDGTRSGKPGAEGWMGPVSAKSAIDLEFEGTPGFQNGEPGDAKAEGSASTIAVFRRVGSPRFVAQQAGVLLHRAIWDFGRNAHRMPTLAPVERGPQPLPITIAEFRPAEDHAVCTRAFETGLCPLADLLALELGERGERRQQNVADEFVLRRQVLFGEAAEADPMRGQALQVTDRRRHAFATEAVERPYQ
jgi:hypothetical protein